MIDNSYILAMSKARNKKCPFCGSDLLDISHIARNYFIACQVCGSTGPWIKELDYESDADAFDAAADMWINRVTT